MFQMKNLILVLCFCVVLSTQQQLKVSVYYESLCPDSINFIVRQFIPVQKLLGNYFETDLVPYGKAIQNKQDNKWVFDCQHGASECYGNKIQACVLKGNDPLPNKLTFVNCIMASYDPSSNVNAERCATTANIAWDPIKTCANSETGSDYLAQYGDQTHAKQKYISFVPTIMYDDQFNAADQKASLRGFKKLLCTKLNNPPECK